MSKESLRSYLSEQAEGQHDTPGAFTLNSARALEQLKRYQLSEPGLWVVKVAQAGVALGAKEVTFTLEYSRTRIRFRGGPPVDGAGIAKALLSGELPTAGWKRHLVSGLRAFLGQNPRRLFWTDQGGQGASLGGDKLQIGPNPLDREAGDRGATLAITAELPKIPANLDRLNFLFRQTGLEHNALCSRLSLCHIPINLDGRRISQRFPPSVAPAKRVGPYSVLVLPEGKLPLQISQSAEVCLAQSSYPAARAEAYRVGALAVLYEPHLAPVSRCFWVKDGALLNSVELAFPYQSASGRKLALDLYLDGNDLDVDLSEFTPVYPQLDIRRLRDGFVNLAKDQDLPEEDRRALVAAFAGLKQTSF